MLLTLLADAGDGCAVLQNTEDEHDGDHDRQDDQARGNQVPHIARHGLIPNHAVSRDYSEAARWYRAAAEHNNAMAQSTLGDIYYYGRGVPQDFVAAVQWWKLAAEQGMAVAQLNLGVMYANGDGASGCSTSKSRTSISTKA
jgi:TPR repeat protein